MGYIMGYIVHEYLFLHATLTIMHNTKIFKGGPTAPGIIQFVFKLFVIIITMFI